MHEMKKSNAQTSFGIFSPTGHVVMAFATEANAQAALAALVAAGFQKDDITYYRSQEVLAQIKEVQELGEKAYQLGQETEKVDRYIELAKQGAGVLSVYAPKDKDSKRAVDIARPFKLKFAEKYNRLTLEELA